MIDDWHPALLKQSVIDIIRAVEAERRHAKYTRQLAKKGEGPFKRGRQVWADVMMRRLLGVIDSIDKLGRVEVRLEEEIFGRRIWPLEPHLVQFVEIQAEMWITLRRGRAEASSYSDRGRSPALAGSRHRPMKRTCRGAASRRHSCRSLRRLATAKLCHVTLEVACRSRSTSMRDRASTRCASSSTANQSSRARCTLSSRRRSRTSSPPADAQRAIVVEATGHLCEGGTWSPHSTANIKVQPIDFPD